MSALVYQPRDFQRDITLHQLRHPRCNVWAGMGSGKTVSTLTALDILLNLLGEAGPVLVLAPLRVARSTWPDEQRKWAHLRHLTVVCAAGDAAERKAALARSAQVTTINYDNLPRLVEYLGKAWPFRTVVADESTRLKSFRLRGGAKRAAQLARVAHSRVERFINPTGTPAPNGLKDLWGQAWFIDAGERLGRTYTAFEQRWFEPERKGKTEYVNWVPRAHAQTEIEERLRDVTLTITNALNVDKPIANVIRVELDKPVMTRYRELEREFFTEISGHEIEALNAAAKSVKCLQFANGAVYVDGTGTAWAEAHRAKIDALESIIEEAAGMPVLVAYHFKSDLARLRKAFSQARELDANPATITAWNAGKIPVLLAHPASAGHGLNLQDGSNILAFFGLWWDLEQHDQIIERIGPTRQKQSGHNRPVFLHYIVAKGTVDETVLARLETKRGVQDLLLEAMKARGAA